MAAILVFQLPALTVWNIEICYNLRHFQLHGRELDDPWSCRHSAIYHQFHYETKRSTWIIIQPPALAEDIVETMDSRFPSHPLGLHLIYVGPLVASWRHYLDYLAGRLKDSVSAIPSGIENCLNPHFAVQTELYVRTMR